MSIREQNVEQVISSIVDLARLKGISINGYTPASLNHFYSLGPSRQKSIAAQLTLYEWILSSIPLAKTHADEITVADELQYVRVALDSYGLKLRDENFYQYLEKGDLVEIYTKDSTQIYRNLEFFRYCSYDLLTLYCVEWFHLYERAEVVTKHIYSVFTDTVVQGRSTYQFNLATHSLRERYLGNHRLFSVDVKCISPLTPISGGEENIACIDLVRVQLISDDATSDRIRHLEGGKSPARSSTLSK